MMTGLAIVIGAPIGVLAGTYLAEFGKHGPARHAVRFVNDVLLSAPVDHHRPVRLRDDGGPHGPLLGLGRRWRWRSSPCRWWCAPPRTCCAWCPTSLREAAAALGAPRWKVITHDRLSRRASGILTGVLLAVARISGETAPLLFTALNNQFWSTDMNRPMANLPVVIFQFAMSPYEDWQQLAWAGALLITFERPGTQHRRAHPAASAGRSG